MWRMNSIRISPRGNVKACCKYNYVIFRIWGGMRFSAGWNEDTSNSSARFLKLATSWTIYSEVDCSLDWRGSWAEIFQSINTKLESIHHLRSWNRNLQVDMLLSYQFVDLQDSSHSACEFNHVILRTELYRIVVAPRSDENSRIGAALTISWMVHSVQNSTLRSIDSPGEHSMEVIKRWSKWATVSFAKLLWFLSAHPKKTISPPMAFSRECNYRDGSLKLRGHQQNRE